MTKPSRDWLFGHSLPQILGTSVIGIIGGVSAWAMGLPLGMLLGSLVAVAIAATMGLRIKGRLPGFPGPWRASLVPVIGVAIGSNVPADVMSQAKLWWPTLLMVLLFVPSAHFASYLLYRRLGGVDARTAFFGSMPGGYIEAIELGERNGANIQMLAMLQFLRIIFCIVMIPLSFAALTGQAVGSSSGASHPGAAVAMTLYDAAILLGSWVLGYVAARAINLPAAILAGPLLASGLAHAIGLTAAAPPAWMILMAQLIMGTALGSRFAGLNLKHLWLACRLSFASILLTMCMAVVIALLFTGSVEQDVKTIVLAFAPGGVGEMALVAISLHLSAIYVTLHHLVRILLAVFFARSAVRYLPPQ